MDLSKDYKNLVSISCYYLKKPMKRNKGGIQAGVNSELIKFKKYVRNGQEVIFGNHDNRVILCCRIPWFFNLYKNKVE